MTDTPRTDEAIEAYDACGKSRDLVLADFARQLERRLRHAEGLLVEAWQEMKPRTAMEKKIADYLAAAEREDGYAV